MSSVYFNKGENCIAAGRLFVEESIHDEYISRVVSQTLFSFVHFTTFKKTIHLCPCFFLYFYIDIKVVDTFK